MGVGTPEGGREDETRCLGSTFAGMGAKDKAKQLGSFCEIKPDLAHSENEKRIVTLGYIAATRDKLCAVILR